MLLHNGREVQIDIHELTVKDWRSFINPSGSPEQETAIVSKVTHLKPEEVEALSWVDYRAVVIEIIKLAKSPIDPNSQSASGSA